ncbi:hypothetical protein CDAR_485881 [Caerostris darwini]|uniref:Uncharacterized protein n=1 Tax=Caerostris darwini TaxID=1538125 RepID=A0AAV4WJ55_9ARAC|nr:hypothetical protein CDAR_485881 [Caerostris darwini]
MATNYAGPSQRRRVGRPSWSRPPGHSGGKGRTHSLKAADWRETCCSERASDRKKINKKKTINFLSNPSVGILFTRTRQTALSLSFCCEGNPWRAWRLSSSRGLVPVLMLRFTNNFLGLFCGKVVYFGEEIP